MRFSGLFCIVLVCAMSFACATEVEKKAVSLHIGDSADVPQNRLVFRTPPQTPFILTAFNDGTLSVSHLDTPIVVFGVSQTLKKQMQSGLRFRDTSVPTKPSSSPSSLLFRSNEYPNRKRNMKEKILGREAGSKLNNIVDDDDFVFSFLQEMGSDTNEKMGKLTVKEKGGEGQKMGKLTAQEKKARKEAKKDVEEQEENNAGSGTGSGTGSGEPTPIKKEAKEKKKPAPPKKPTVKEQIDDLSVQRSNGDEHITFMHMKNMHVKGTLSVANPGAVVGAISQWAMVAFDDMETDEIRQSYSHADHSVCGGGAQGAVVPDIFLGGHCKFSDVEVSKDFTELPPHKYIRLQLRYHFFDKWLGDWGYVKIGNEIVWSGTHHHCPKVWEDLCGGISVCGDANYNDRLSAYVDVTLPHTSDSMTVQFGSSLKGDPCDASWGIDDVQVSCL